MPTKRYYYVGGSGEAIGPLEIPTIQSLAEQGIISSNTPVIAEGDTTWSTAGQSGLLPPKNKRSFLQKIMMGCIGLLVGYAVIVVLAIIVLHAFGSKRDSSESSTPENPQATTLPTAPASSEELRFEGYCVNETYGTKATMTLALRQAPNGFVGELTLAGDLSGGGPLFGHIDANKVYFTSRSDDGLEIAWVGELRDDRIVGRYVVPHSEAIKQQTGKETQEGHWEVKRKP